MQIQQLLWTNGVWQVVGDADSDPLSLRSSWDSEQTFGLVFGPSHFLDMPAAFEELEAMFPQVRWMGASSSGVIHADQVSEGSLRISLLRFDHAQMQLASAECPNYEDSYEVARQLGDALLAKGQLSSAIVFADGLHTAGHEILRGLNDGTEGVPVAGGMAADGTEFDRTWVIHRGRPAQRAIAVLGFYGNTVQISQACDSGPVVFGPIRRVTGSADSTLLTLDGRPALQVYRDYMGEHARQLPASAAHFPLAMKRTKADERTVMRFVLEVDEKQQSLRLAGDIPVGSYVQFSRATHQQLIKAASFAGQQAAEGLSACPEHVFSLVVSCAGRRLCLGERTGEEIESVLAELPLGSSQSGFFSYGELAAHPGSFADMHNMTMTVIAIRENASAPDTLLGAC